MIDNLQWPLVPLTQSDSGELLDLISSVGWKFTLDQVELHLNLGQFYGHRVAGRLVSSAGIYLYHDHVASIGLVIVHPDFQGNGLGKAVVRRCIEEARHHKRSVVVLVATPAGLPLYNSLGFQTVETIRRLQSAGLTSWETESGDKARGVEILPLQGSDMDEVVAFDERSFGAKREKMLDAWFHRGEGAHVARDDSGTVCGFVMAMRRGSDLHVGPLHASDSDIAVELMRSVANHWVGGLRIDVPSYQEQFVQRLTDVRFVQSMTSPMMTYGGIPLPALVTHWFALSEPALG